LINFAPSSTLPHQRRPEELLAEQAAIGRHDAHRAQFQHFERGQEQGTQPFLGKAKSLLKK
jgi:hypothetical protein